MKKKGLSAVTLRGILGTSIVLLILLAGVGFYFAQNWLHTFAVSVSHTIADSKASNTGLQSLHTLQDELSNQQDIITKTNSLFASSTSYQTQAVQDLSTYATATGITITNYSFPVGAPTTTTSTLPNTQVTIGLGSPVSYTNLLKFITEIEGNLPKMQVTGISLSRISGDSSSVKIDQLTIAVYTR
ncbi:hypothetical protein EPN95_04110 [Patescibacteria group bacterium]|nr:MAG: hypothetical protein EPN95_04110 [Patescibacteria group bacterium]